MSDAYRVDLRTLDGGPTSVGSAGPFTLVADRPREAGGRGLGFNGGQLFYLSIAACVCNDLYREAAAKGIMITRVAVRVDGDFPGRGAESTAIDVEVELEGDAPAEELARLVAEVDELAEIPKSIRQGTEIRVRQLSQKTQSNGK